MVPIMGMWKSHLANLHQMNWMKEIVVIPKMKKQQIKKGQTTEKINNKENEKKKTMMNKNQS